MGTSKSRRASLVAALCSFSVLFAGCAVGPDFETPEHPLPAQFAESSPNGVQGEAVLSEWWSTFNDPRLTALIQDSIRNNYSVAVAVSRVNEARALRQKTFYNLLPTVIGTAGYTKSNDSDARIPFNAEDADLTHEIYHAGGDATWEIDLFGRVRRQVEQASAQEQASIEELRDVLRTVLSDVATNYFSLRGNQAALAVAQRNARAQEESVKLTEAQAQNGMISELDVARAKAQLSATLSEIPVIEASIKLAIHRIAVLTGKNPEALIPDLTPVEPLPRYEGPVGLGDPAGLIRRRPDVRASEQQLASFVAGVGVAEGDYFPRVTFNGTLGYEAFTPRRFGYSNTTASTFGPSITWAAFDMGRVIAQVHAAGAQAEGALAEYHQSVLTALEEVENSLVQYGAQRQRRDHLKEAALQSAKAANLARDRYQAGITDFLAVLDAQRVQLLAEVQLSNSETQLAINLVGIYKALGGGWEAAILTPELKQQ